MVFLEFWLGVKNLEKLVIFFQKFPKSNLGFAWNCKFFKNFAWIWPFFLPPLNFSGKTRFYSSFVHQFFAKILEFPKFRALFGKKFGEFCLKMVKIANFSKILLVNLCFGRSVAKSCLNLSVFWPPLRIFANFGFLLHFCTSNFGHFGVNSQKKNFPLQNLRFLAKSLKNLA